MSLRIKALCLVLLMTVVGISAAKAFEIDLPPPEEGMTFYQDLRQDNACQLLGCSGGKGYSPYYKFTIVRYDPNADPGGVTFKPYTDAGWFGEGLCTPINVVCPYTTYVASNILQGYLTCPDGYGKIGIKCVRTDKDPYKNNACCEGDNGPVVTGNPIHIGTGQKLQTENDFNPGRGELRLVRYYGSENHWGKTTLGWNWRHNFMRSLMIYGAPGIETVIAIRAAGNQFFFLPSAGTWQSEGDVRERLAETKSGTTRTGWTLTLADNSVEQYDLTGRLFSIAYQSGEVLTLSYSAGQLTDVGDTMGRHLRLNYTDDLLGSVILPDGTSVNYSYTLPKLLAQADYYASGGASVGSRQYLYEDVASARLLTGITDEQQARFASWSYDQLGRAVISTHGDVSSLIDRVSVDYSSPAPAVTDSLGGVTHYSYTVDKGVVRITGVDHMCVNCGSASKTRSYDGNGFPDIVTDFNNSITDFDRNVRGLETQRIEGKATTSQRTIQTGWHDTLSIPKERSTLNAGGALIAKSTWTYNARGQALTNAQLDPTTSTTRTTTTTYCEQANLTAGTCPLLGLVTSVDGPRTDVSDLTTYTYRMADEASCATAPATCLYRKGDLWKVTNALNQVAETLKYDGAGRVLSVKDPNGVITDLEYHPRGWLTARKVRGIDNAVETDDQITRIAYWPTGLVKQVTQADGAFTAYTYDAAHRLTDISDNANNTIHYTLDNAGNRTKEDTKDTLGGLKRTLSRVYNQLGQLQDAYDADPTHAPTHFTYDANGNGDLVTDALSRITDSDYDPLNRLSRSLQNVGGINAQTTFAYDAQDNLTKVTDPKGLDTTYGYNGLGELLQLASPDTGTTGYTYDSGGNRKTQTDARGKLSTYSYDGLNRLTGITYPTTSLNVTYTYDTAQAVCTTGETFTKGRLTKVTDASGTTQTCFDRFGQLVRKVQTTNAKVFTVRYSYTPTGQLQTLTYPDGRVATYTRDSQGRTTGISVSLPGGDCPQVLVQGVQYYPFGPAMSWIFGDGSGSSSAMGAVQGSPSQRTASSSLCVGPTIFSRSFSRSLNQNYQPGFVEDTGAGGLSLGYQFDAVGNLIKLRNAPQYDPPQRLFGYDGLNRLAEVKDGTSLAVLQGYGYDATGNRTSATAGTTSAYTYPTTSHRLSQVGAVARSYDSAGNTTQIGGTARQFVYNDASRMSQVKAGITVTMNYLYNGKGEQVRKSLGTANTYTVYDEAGHWLGDYDNAGAPIQQAIWMDDLPVGLLANGTLHYVEADALGTPRVVIDPLRDVAVWKWDLAGEAFGNTVPNQNPDGDANSLVFNMRFPGQRYDATSGLNYNYFRDYEAASGRYAESDPIGLKGGISTYSYVADRPLNLADPFGLDYWLEGSVPGEGGHPYHQSVCVGKRGTSNRYCISFGVDESGCLMDCKGAVYNDFSAEGPLVNVNRTTQKQDESILQLMQSQVGTPGRYYLIGNNCRDFSQAFFKKLESQYGNFIGLP